MARVNRALRRFTVGLRRITSNDPRLVLTALVHRSCAAREHGARRQIGRAEQSLAALPTFRARRGLAHLCDRPRQFERPMFTALKFVNRHPDLAFVLMFAFHVELAGAALIPFTKSCAGTQCYLATARSLPAGTDLALGPSAVGVMSKSKISVGMASVAQAFGISTMPLIRPSTGAVPKIAYA